MQTRRNTKKGRTRKEWLDGVRQSTNKHGLTEEDVKETVKRFGQRKTPYSGQYLNE